MEHANTKLHALPSLSFPIHYHFILLFYVYHLYPNPSNSLIQIKTDYLACKYYT